jgi:hypothetical protein
VVTILGYVVAMVLHAAEYAFGTRSHVGRAAQRPARQLVGAGGPGPVAAPVSDLGGEVPPGGPVPTRISGRLFSAPWIGWVGVGVFGVGLLAHLGTLVTRGLSAHRMPWGNMYEFILSVTFVGAVAWLVVLARRPGVRHLGLFVALVLVLLLGVAGMVTYVPAGPLVPALDSYWFVVHVSAVALSSGIFLLAFVPAVLYLARTGYDEGGGCRPPTCWSG